VGPDRWDDTGVKWVGRDTNQVSLTLKTRWFCSLIISLLVTKTQKQSALTLTLSLKKGEGIMISLICVLLVVRFHLSFPISAVFRKISSSPRRGEDWGEGIVPFFFWLPVFLRQAQDRSRENDKHIKIVVITFTTFYSFTHILNFSLLSIYLPINHPFPCRSDLDSNALMVFVPFFIMG